MPIYQYKCQDCGYGWDELILKPTKFKSNLKCPKCQQSHVDKEITNIAMLGSDCGSCSGSCSSCGEK